MLLERKYWFQSYYLPEILNVTSPFDKSFITSSSERFILPSINIDEVVIGGGGAYNPTLMKFIRHYLPKHINLKTHEDYGISNNFKEVMAFALLGYCTYYGIPNNLPECTGANQRIILGKVANCF